MIEKEQIDVLIKYIDLSDPLLKREGIPQIKKDENNKELKYCIRSILKNIPWIRKIYILMPNEKVEFLKEYDLIKEKIVYVKDKDILGFDSANSRAFQFSLFKMKKFNISDNFIIMDDDYFIGQPLKKSDFFYVENGKVVPSIIAKKFNFEDSASASKNHKLYLEKALKAEGQTSEFFMYAVYSTYLFIMKQLNKKSLIIPYFTHNALPVNINDIKEIYDLLYNSEYKSSTLDSLNRDLESLQFHTFIMSYTFNKYNKKVNSISYNYIDNNDAIKGNYNYPLFCINTGAKEYSAISFKKARIVMESLFPNPSPYEIIDFSEITSLSFDIISEMENEINKYQEEIKNYKIEIKEIEEKQNTQKNIKNDDSIIISRINKDLDKYKNEIDIIQKEKELLKIELEFSKDEELLKNINYNKSFNNITAFLYKELKEKERNITKLTNQKDINNNYFINRIINLKDELEGKNQIIKSLEFDKNKIITISNIYFYIIEIIVLLLILFFIYSKIRHKLIRLKIKEIKNEGNNENKKENEKGKDQLIEMKNINE